MKKIFLPSTVLIGLFILFAVSCGSRGYKVKMVEIPAGSFLMGQKGIAEPVHKVTLSAFLMSRYEITNGQFNDIIRSNMPYFKGLSQDDLPAEHVTWWKAIEYCNALSKKEGFQPCYDLSSGACDYTRNGFRLPTEAEWEYACRAGTETKYYTGNLETDLNQAGWYFSNSGNKAHPVGGKKPNPWGLYDMHGNAWEWCNDWYGDYHAMDNYIDPKGPKIGFSRIVRGGGWWSGASACRSAARGFFQSSISPGDFGFRVVRHP